jgi:hypothetical protein
MCMKSKRPHHLYVSHGQDSHIHLGTSVHARSRNESVEARRRKRQCHAVVSHVSEDWVTSNFISGRDIAKASHQYPTPGIFVDSDDIADREANQTLTATPRSQTPPASEAEFSRHRIYLEPKLAADENLKVGNIGQSLLYHHDWRHDGGLGPKIKRYASLDDEATSPNTIDARVDQYLFQSVDLKLPSNWLDCSSGLTCRNSMIKYNTSSNSLGTNKGVCQNKDGCHLSMNSSIPSSQNFDEAGVPSANAILAPAQLLASQRHISSKDVRNQSCENRPSLTVHNHGPVTLSSDLLPGFTGVIRDLDYANVSTRSFLRTITQNGQASRPKIYEPIPQPSMSVQARSSDQVNHGRQGSVRNERLTHHNLRTFTPAISHRFTSATTNDKIYPPRPYSDLHLQAFSSDTRINVAFEPSHLLRIRLNI